MSESMTNIMHCLLFFLRFCSSAIGVLESLYKAYHGYVKTYVETRETEDDCDMMKYKVRGYDFALQLCLFFDIFDDFKAVMEKMQNLQSNIWLPVDLVPHLRSLLEERELALGQLQDLPNLKSLNGKLFHRTLFNADDLAEGRFKGHDLLEGWLIKPTKGKKVEWVKQDFVEVIADVKSFVSMLNESIRKR